MLASALSCSFPTCPARRVSEGYQIMANCIRLDWPQWMRPPRDLGRAEQPLPYQGVGKQIVTQEPNAGVRFLPLNRHGLASATGEALTGSNGSPCRPTTCRKR